MGEALFYHVTDSRPEDVLPSLLAKALAAGWRCELRLASRQRAEALDLRLWTEDPQGFLPHGLAGDAQEAHQPVLLTAPPEGLVAAEARPFLMALDGAPVLPEEVRTRARASIVFDGTDPDGVARARDQWRELTGAGLGARYWAQEGGRWVMKSEKAASA